MTLGWDNITVHIPLLFVLVFLTIDELRSGLIRDVVTLPGCLYFFIARLVVGPAPWWNYLLGGLGLYCALRTLAACYERKRGVSGLGGGAMKMYCLIGFALGIVPGFASLLVAAALIGTYGGVAYVVKTIEVFPTSPFSLGGVLLVLCLQWYGLIHFAAL